MLKAGEGCFTSLNGSTYWSHYNDSLDIGKLLVTEIPSSTADNGDNADDYKEGRTDHGHNGDDHGHIASGQGHLLYHFSRLGLRF